MRVQTFFAKEQQFVQRFLSTLGYALAMWVKLIVSDRDVSDPSIGRYSVLHLFLGGTSATSLVQIIVNCIIGMAPWFNYG